MIIENEVKKGDVVTIKLTSGEELIAILDEHNNEFIKIKKPRVLANAGNGIGIAPYLFTVDPDRTIRLYRTTVVVMEPTEKGYATQYTETTTGIIV